MKKIISLLLVLCMLVGTTSALVPTASALTHGYLSGDANDDADVTTKDILLVRKFVAGTIGEKELDTVASDVDFDDDVTTKDILKIRKCVAGIISLDENNTDGMYRVDKVSIADKNIARYTVVIPKNPDACMNYSAKLLKDYVKRECGITLNIKTEGDAVEGYRIRYVYDVNDENALGKEGYRVVVGNDGDMTLYCGSMRGPLYVT